MPDTTVVLDQVGDRRSGKDRTTDQASPYVHDRPAGELDDRRDRDELRQRYYGLLQELRVLLPGVQVLMGFLLTVPFATGFDRIDDVERIAFGVALSSAAAATVSFVAPTAFHRVARRTARSARLVWAIRMLEIGLGFLGLATVSALFCVTRFVFGPWAAVGAASAITSMIVVLWLVIPMLDGRENDAGPHDNTTDG